jgi:hypothetical protein
MAVFDELVAQVNVYTNRADLVAETELAVRQATLLLHSSDMYSKDMLEGAAVLAFSASNFQLDMPSLFPRFRAFSYLRTWDAIAQLPGTFFEVLRDPRAILDEYGTQRTQIAYVAGMSLNIKAAADINGIMWGYISSPPVWPKASYKSWIAFEWPEAIHVAAAAHVYRAIGNMEEANKFQAYTDVWIKTLQTNNLEGVQR